MTNFLSTNQNDLARALSDQKRAMEEREAQRHAQDLHLPYVNLQNFPLDLNALALISEAEAKTGEAIPFYKDMHDIRVGTINPNNALLREKIKELGKTHTVILYVISRSSFNATLKFYAKVVTPTSKFKESIEVETGVLYRDLIKNLAEATDQTAASELLTVVAGAAIAEGASDIHFEPEENIVKVRFRVDGVLHDAVHIPKPAYKPALSRIKLMSKLKLNVDTAPQDGRFTIMNGHEPLDIRVSVLPSSYGEAIVMRLLGVGAVSLDVDELGFAGKASEVIHAQLQKPNGMIIATGPTGSGKTTTLYAFLQELNDPGVKIITLEDPVEYKVEGIQQTPIDHRVDFNFAKGLRSVLRQDPDIVMVGEIRDPETAETALQAALTGHVVLTTLHTNDAAGAIPRLVTMGVKPFSIAPAVNAIIAQRLVRKICPSCMKAVTLPAPMLERVMLALKDIPDAAKISVPSKLEFYHSTGCNDCNGIGYKGRTQINEVIEVTDDLRALILEEPAGMTIKALAKKNGMLTMEQDGLLKALQKITDVEEVFRVIG